MSERKPRGLPSNRRTAAFERRIARALDALGCNGPVVVAASGGADSTATLVAVTCARGPASVTAAHFDHRLRSAEEAARDREAVAHVADCLGVRLVTGRAPRKPTDRSEAAARAARYRWLARACREAGATACITGHTLDDQAETVLLRLARGTGALGAAGMRPESPWPIPGRVTRQLRLLRPLLEVTRGEVEAYLDALGVTPSPDASNETAAYARNRVRSELMPVLREVNPRAVEHLAEFAAAQRQDDEALTRLAQQWLEEHSTRSRGSVTMMRQELRALPVAVAARVVREAAGGLGVRLEAAHLRAILASLGKSGGNVDLPLAHSRTSDSLLELRTQPSSSRTGLTQATMD